MRELIPNIQANLSAMGYHPEILIDYIKSFFGEVILQFWMGAVSGANYQIIVVHTGIFFYFSFNGTKIETNVQALRDIGRIYETFDGSQYFVNLFDSGGRLFYNANTNHIELIKNYRRLVNILLSGMH